MRICQSTLIPCHRHGVKLPTEISEAYWRYYASLSMNKTNAIKTSLGERYLSSVEAFRGKIKFWYDYLETVHKSSVNNTIYIVINKIIANWFEPGHELFGRQQTIIMIIVLG